MQILVDKKQGENSFLNLSKGFLRGDSEGIEQFWMFLFWGGFCQILSKCQISLEVYNSLPLSLSIYIYIYVNFSKNTDFLREVLIKSFMSTTVAIPKKPWGKLDLHHPQTWVKAVPGGVKPAPTPPNVGGWSLTLGSRHVTSFQHFQHQSQNCQGVTRWWFQIFFIFTPIRGRFPIWLIFFRWVETTNQSRWFHDLHLFQQLGNSARHHAIFASSSPVRCGFGHYRWWIFDLCWCLVDSCGFTKNGPKSREWIRNQGITHGILHGHDLSCDDYESYLSWSYLSWWGYLRSAGIPIINHVWFHSLLRASQFCGCFFFGRVIRGLDL